jgi:glycosyltransferase involved in cell wall biosynthesis
MKMPKISVVIPTYNRAHCLANAIDSVLAQRFQDFELIVVDDGSTDETSDLIDSYNSRVKLVSQPNSGVSVARNSGIKLAQGQWIAFLDSDDTWELDKLWIQMDDLKNCPQAGLHAVDASIQISEGHYDSLFKVQGVSREYAARPFRERPMLEAFRGTFYVQCSLIKRPVLEKVGIFNPLLKICEDIEFMARAALETPFLINPYIGTKIRRLVEQCESLSTLCQLNKIEWYRTKANIFRYIKNDPRLTSLERRMVCRNLGGVLCDIYKEYCKINKWDSALASLKDSIVEDPGLRSIARALWRSTISTR